MKHLPERAATAFELRFCKQTNGSERWHDFYNRPSIDFTLRGFDLGNRDVLGFGLGGALLFSKPILRTDHFIWKTEIGYGFGIVSKPFDYRDNYKNIAIGSYLNIFAVAGTKLDWLVSSKVRLSSSLSFNHFSNTAIAIPNLGLNYPMVSVGIGYTPKPEKDSIYFREDILIIQKSYWQWTANFGFTETQLKRDVKFPVFSGSFDRSFGLNQKISLATGLDVFYNSSLLLSKRANNLNDSPLRNLQVGTHVSYQLHIDKMMLMLGLGAYIIDDFKRNGWNYARIGARYFVTEHWGINFTIKTHKFKADYFELGVAHRF